MGDGGEGRVVGAVDGCEGWLIKPAVEDNRVVSQFIVVGGLLELVHGVGG